MSGTIRRGAVVLVGLSTAFATVAACGSTARSGAGNDAGVTQTDGGTLPPPSCAPGGDGVTNCGANGESCCTSLEVPGGTFHRTYENDGSGPTRQADPATISGFRLDKYEVTVGRFRQYVRYLSSGGKAPDDGSGKHTHVNGGQGLSNSATPGTLESGWNAAEWDLYIATDAASWNTTLACDPASHAYATWTNDPGPNEKLPVSCVNWYEAYAFCIWDGGFLPTEAEWEYAAAAGAEEREYVWGTAAPGTTNQYAIYDCQYPSGTTRCASVANVAPVGTATLGAGAFGQLDMAGSMAEWPLDYWDDAVYANPCVDCAYLTPIASQGVYPFRPVRGSSFKDDSSPPIFLVPPGRNYATGSGHDEDIGFRCARVP